MELDQDLQARQQARAFARQAETAQKQLSNMHQQQLNAITEAIAADFQAAARELAVLAAEETGFGNPEDKTIRTSYGR